MKRIAGTIALILVLQACGEKTVEPAATIIGVWKLAASNDQPVDVNYTISFRDDGSYTFTNTIFDGTKITSEGVWSIEGGRITLDSEQFVLRLMEDTLILIPVNGSGSFTYEKQ